MGLISPKKVGHDPLIGFTMPTLMQRFDKPAATQD
jgi:hypothetical protein